MVRNRTPFLTAITRMVVIGGAAAIVLMLGQRLFTDAPSPTYAPVSPYTMFANARYHYSLSYPTGWRVDTNSMESSVATITAYRDAALAQDGVSDPALAKVDIVALPVAPGTSVADFVRQHSDAPLEATLVPTYLGDADALRVTTLNTDGGFTYTTIFAVRGSYGYILAGMAPAATFSRIAKSFQFN